MRPLLASAVLALSVLAPLSAHADSPSPEAVRNWLGTSELDGITSHGIAGTVRTTFVLEPGTTGRLRRVADPMSLRGTMTRCRTLDTAGGSHFSFCHDPQNVVARARANGRDLDVVSTESNESLGTIVRAKDGYTFTSSDGATTAWRPYVEPPRSLMH